MLECMDDIEVKIINHMKIFDFSVLYTALPHADIKIKILQFGSIANCISICSGTPVSCQTQTHIHKFSHLSQIP